MVPGIVSVRTPLGRSSLATLRPRVQPTGAGFAPRTCAGLVQFAFTLATLLAFIATYYLPQLALAWQVCKFAFPVYHGSKYTCERMIKVCSGES
jgi:hypothetical protein